MDPRAMRQARAKLRAAAADARNVAGRNRPGRTRWRRLRRHVGSWLLAVLVPWLLRLLALTWRVQRSGDRGCALQHGSSPWIVAMWHGRMLMLMPLRHHRGRGIGVLVSPSDDGALAERVLRHFRYRIVRGSMSRGGARALRAMDGLLTAGSQLVVTPDGPRGPRHGVNVGVAWLARRTGAPIVPVAAAVDRAWRLRSWDRFTIPKPFARIVVHYGDPVVVAPDAGDEQLETVATGLRAQLLMDERAAFARLCVGDDHAA